MDKIEKTLTVLKIFDQDSDPKRDYLFQDPEYQKQDQERYDSWLKDEWYMLGIRVRVKVHNWTTGVTAVYESAGLWGIESDCDESYFREVAAEELQVLQSEYPNIIGPMTLDSTGSINWKEQY